jgi:dihydrofolate reductase
MRKVVSGLFYSLDGVVESPEKWTFDHFTDELGAEITGQMDASDAMLLGRQTYQEFASYWPGKTAADDPMADRMNGAQKLVASTTLTEPLEWENSTLLKGNAADELRRLKEQPGKNFNIVGSPTLVRSLLKDGVLDELRLLVYPVVLGSGKRLFDGGLDRVPMKLAGSKAFATGVILLVYEPERPS